MGIDFEKLQALVKENPELMEDTSLTSALDKLEGKVAQKRLGGVADKIKNLLDECFADGSLPPDDAQRVHFLDIKYVEVEEGSPFSVTVNTRKGRTTNKGKKAGASVHGITKELWAAKGYQYFKVGNRSFNQPIKAIEAAGGERKKKEDGTLKSENYWRAILENGFTTLPITVVMKKADGTNEDKSLTEVREMFTEAA